MRIYAAYHLTRWVFILVICYSFFMPEGVMGMEEDPYRFNTIRLDIDLTYTNQSYRTSDKTDNIKGFEQRYRLDVKGLVINPNLMIYNAGIEFVDADTGGTYGESHSNLNKYVFGSTLLRKSRIPLTLAASRSTTDTTFGGETTKDTFGADWYLKFKTLPWTRLTYNKAQTQATGINEETESSGIGVSKAIGPTDNSISYSTTTTANSISNYGLRNNVLAIRNDTTVPLSTKFYMGVVNNDSLSFSDTYKIETDTTAGSVGLRTEPIAGFGQNYNYTFTNTESGAGYEKSGITKERNSDSEYFNGRIDYNPSKSLNMIMGIQSLLNETSSSTSDTMSNYSDLSTSDNYYSKIDYNPSKSLNMFMDIKSLLKNKTSSATSDTMTKSINLSTGTRYIINSELSTTESIKYSLSEATSGDPLTGKTERTIIDTSAALNYLKELSWAALSTSASLGHYKEMVKPDVGGEGVSYSFNTGLSGINMNYFTLSSGYTYSGVDSPDVYRKEQTFTSNANSSYIRHLPLTAHYIYYTLDSYLDGEDGVENTVGANASMLYLKKLPITASYSQYTLVRPNDPTSDLQYVYIREKVENTVTATASMLYLKWLPISASYSHYTLVQLATQVANPSADQQNTHVADKKEDTISLSSSLIYFKNTTVSASAAHKNYTESVFNSYSWVSEENNYSQRNMGINGSHSTRLYRGSLVVSTEYNASTKNNTTANTKEETSNLDIKGTYNKRVSRNMMWKLEAERRYTDTNGQRNTTISGQTNIFYRLRQWLLSAEYSHAIREQETTGSTTVIEDKVMLKLSRSFFRTF